MGGPRRVAAALAAEIVSRPKAGEVVEELEFAYLIRGRAGHDPAMTP